MGDLVSVPGKGMFASPNPAQTEPQPVCFLAVEYARTRELLHVDTHQLILCLISLQAFLSLLSVTPNDDDSPDAAIAENGEFAWLRP